MGKQCAWCLRILEDGKWRKGPGRKIAGVSHGMCRECQKIEMEKYKAARKAA